MLQAYSHRSFIPCASIFSQREVEKPNIRMSSLKEDVIKALKDSGWEKLLHNKVYAALNRWEKLAVCFVLHPSYIDYNVVTVCNLHWRSQFQSSVKKNH